MPEWIGKTIGKVRIEKLLARGGMAEVYLGTHLALARPVAVKLLHSYIEEEPTLLERFHREAKVVASLRHPNIVQIFDFDSTDGHPYIVMEYLKGPTLAAYLRHLHQRKKRLPSEQIAALLNGLTDALDYAHREGVIHRDIKPGNIILHNKTDAIPLDQPLTNDVEAILTDFGLVRIVDAATQTASGLVSGTPAYMSPEQARGDQIDQSTDIYSLGVVLYEMLAGRVPFEADNTVTILHMHIHMSPPPIPGIPAKVQAVLDHALAKNPNDRYQTSLEMVNDFYLAIGMNAQAEIIHGSEPVNTVPVEASVSLPSKPEPIAAAPAPLPKPQVQTEREPTPKPQARIEPVSAPKSQVRTEPKSAPKPARSRSWIGVGLISLVLIGLLALGGYRLFADRPNVPEPTEALGPIVPNTGVSPLPSEIPNLPAAAAMVQIKAGSYELGLSPADDNHVAPTTIDLPDFWIDQYLVINAKYQQYMTETGAPQPAVWPGQGDHPVIGVTWDQALAYCQWVHKRLPSEAEWEAAGRGPGTVPQLYPWGNDVTANGQALKWPDQDTYPVGTQSFNKSPFGVFDMVGNVWEWVGEPYASGQAGVKFLRGGRYGLPINDLAYRLAVAPDDTRYIKFASFRCAADQVR
jgi:serine/threonine protein kinase